MNRPKDIKLMAATIILVGAMSCSLNTPVTEREKATGIGALAGGAGGAIIGSVTGSALAGGLVGMPLGALAGYYYGDKLIPSPGDVVRSNDDEQRASVTFADVMFETDSSEIKRDAMPHITPVVSYLKDNPTRWVWIEGHTDSVGERMYNLQLSTERAEAVRDVLIASGIDKDRVATVGSGEAKPIAPNDTAEGRKMNRRVEIDVF
jgi:outer membrane protein OmpA-like peptidoglycan-associated protein